MGNNERAEVLFTKITDLLAILRKPGACGWCRKQTLKSLIPHILEETEEVRNAIELKDKDNLCEELGDLLRVILMMIGIAQEQKLFTYSDVLAEALGKSLRRHAYIFDKATRGSLSSWERVKKEEKINKGGI